MVNDIRFRLEGEVLVLQLGETTKPQWSDMKETKWKDATVEDLLDVAMFLGKKYSTEVDYQLVRSIVLQEMGHGH